MSRPRCIDIEIPLHGHTSLRVGGPARFFARPPGEDEAAEVLRWSEAQDLGWVALGAGTNAVFSDRGFHGVVVATSGLRGLEVGGRRIRAGAGESLPHVARMACEAGLSGLEWACGIPGSVGGAVVMNAGTREGEVAGVLDSVRSAGVDGLHTRQAGSLAFAYRESPFRTGELREAVTEATFELIPSTREKACSLAERLLLERRRTQPEGASAGCTFRNPPDGPTAGQLLDRAGCKSLRVGRARVSELHANFILNEGTQNAGDVLALIEEMKRRVRDTFGIELIEEIALL
jgi:UDP-N-acetylmuramate dehydrogenase